MLEQGIYERQVLALMPVNWQYLNAISVQIAPLTPAQAFHPNILDYEDADAGDMGHGADEGEEHETEEADPNREDRNPAEEVNPGIDANEGSTGSRATSSTVTMAVAAAPWRMSTTAMAKPKTRKLEPYHFFSACIFMGVFDWSQRTENHMSCCCLGDPGRIELSSRGSGRQLAKWSLCRATDKTMMPTSGESLCKSFSRVFLETAYAQGGGKSISHKSCCFVQGYIVFLIPAYRTTWCLWTIFMLFLTLRMMVLSTDIVCYTYAVYTWITAGPCEHREHPLISTWSILAGSSYKHSEHYYHLLPLRSNRWLNEHEMSKARSLRFH